MSGVATIDYVQNETQMSRLTANYNLTQPVGPKSYNIIDTVANGIQASSDAFNVNSIGSHLKLHRTSLTLNFVVPYSGIGTESSSTPGTYLAYPFIWCPYSDWLDQDCVNKMITQYEISGAFNYKSNDQVYRNPDTREIICHSYNKVQCEKYGLYRSPYSCLTNLAVAGSTPWRSVDWNPNAGPNNLYSANGLQFYSKENLENWIYQQNLKTKPVITVTNLVSTATTPPALTSNTDSYGNIVAYDTTTSNPYFGPFTCNINISITLEVSDKLIDSVLRSDEGQAIRIDNKQLTYTFYYNQYYINSWLIKSARVMTGSATGFGMAVKSNAVSSSLRVYGFTTNLPDNGLFTKPFYDWSNQRMLTVTLANGSIPFKIELPQLEMLPSLTLLYASPQLWNGGNAGAVQAFLTALNLHQFNMGHNVFAQLNNVTVQVDNEIVSQTLDNDYFRRETAKQNMGDGEFDDKLYRKITLNYAQPLYGNPTEDVSTITGGVPYLIMDFSKLCLDSNVPLVRNDRPKNVVIYGTITLDPTTTARLTPAALNALNSMQMTVFCYDLKPAVMRLDPNNNTITNDYITANTITMSSLDVQTQMKEITQQLGVPTLNFSDRLSGGNIGGSFFDTLKKFVLPILKPIMSFGFKKIADNMKNNTAWTDTNQWMPAASPVFDAFGDWVGSGKGKKVTYARRPIL